MATELDQAYRGWHHEELSGQEHTQDDTITQMLDHGSISFGRYAAESLAWEKRSVFTHNRRQEELEKLKAPGLVAQKKAYFEAYYKKIRDLKALQANEQTELILDDGEDGKFNCQNKGIKDENSVEHEAITNEVPNVATACSEEHDAEIALKTESTGAFCCRVSDSEPVLTCPDISTGNIKGDTNSMDAHLSNDMVQEPAGTCTDSSTRTFKDIDMDKNSVGSLEHRHLYPESSVPNDDMGKTDVENTEFKQNCGEALKIGNIPKEFTSINSSRRMEVIELCRSLCNDDGKRSPKETHDAQYSVDSGTCSEHNFPDSLMQKRSVSELSPVDNHIIEKSKILVNKQMEHSSKPRMKESVSSVRKIVKEDSKTKSAVAKASQRLTHFIHKTTAVGKNSGVSKAPFDRWPSKSKSTSDSSYRPHNLPSSLMVGKETNSSDLQKASCNRLPSEKRPASVSSNRRPKESSNFTIAHPFPFITRQATTPSGIRENGQQTSYSWSLNGPVRASQQLATQRTSSVKRCAANGVKTEGLEKKSHHGEILKKATVPNSHPALSRARDGLLQRPEARSVNFLAVSKCCLTSRTGSGIKGESTKEGKTNAKPRLFEGTSRLAAAPLARTDKTNLRKQVSSQNGGLLLEGKKSRQELKPWR